MQRPGGAALIEYVHDPLGRRIAKKVGGAVVEKYQWSGMTQLLAVYEADGTLRQRFEYAGGRLPVAMTAGGARYYLGYDQVGSLRAVADDTGAVVKQIAYDSFGNVLSETNAEFELPFGFAGGLRDADTGLTRFGFRDYDPEIGRWTAKDPIGFSGGDNNLYGYCVGDPVNWSDPNGLLSVYVWYPTQKDSYGHASLALDDGKARTYISWWPDEPREGALDKVSNGRIYHAPAYPKQTYEDDKAGEGRLPDEVIPVSGLDEEAIKEWWDKFRTENEWRTFQQNCSTTVAEALKAGGADVGWGDVFSAHNIVWTPRKVAAYASAINSHMCPYVKLAR